jgi:hypothetical protein
MKNEEDPFENKKWLGAMFWQNLVNEKMVKFWPHPRPVDMRFFHRSVH